MFTVFQSLKWPKMNIPIMVTKLSNMPKDFCPLHHLMLVRSWHYQWTKENPIKNPKALLWSRPLGSKHKMYLRRPNTTTHRVIGVHSMCLTPARVRRLCMRSKVTWPVQAITLAPFFVYLLNRVAAFSHWAELQNLEAKCFWWFKQHLKDEK